MVDHDLDQTQTAPTATLPRIAVPPVVRASPEEIARRRALFARVIALREAIGPIGMTTDELVHYARTEDDISDG